ncbi:MAG: Gfo/Idh/MocA family oxidoreductase [Actinomycetaceae bacterium]|nr:Gfo/Idh/MocA family oxidoreductase [Actinomycetaceae bacterium]MDY6082329.1 Gfo/Idh/MocA family oxidoreductase [Actinomycetaceae bacterium]
MADLRVGVIGLGSMGRHHVRNVRETPGETLVAVADADGDRYAVAGDLPILPDVDALIDAGIDAAIIAVPTALHADTGVKLAHAGVHVMIEKPLASEVSEGEALVHAFDEAGLIAAAGYVERCNPAMREMHKRIAAGELGAIFQISSRRQGPFPARITDVGVVKDLATHDVDVAQWIGGARYSSVAAQTARTSGRQHEDFLISTGQLENGVLVNHIVNWFSPFKERVTVVSGEKGTFVADTMNSTLTFFENGTKEVEWDQVANVRGVSVGEVKQYALEVREPLRVEHEHFVKALNGDTSDIVPIADALQTLRVVDAMLQSADTNTTVSL